MHSTIPIIQTTVPVVQKTIPQIQTTIPIIQTTIPQIQTTISQIRTTVPVVHSTIPLIQTTIPQIQTTVPLIHSTIPQIQTTVPLVQTTIPQIQTTVPVVQTTVPLVQTTVPLVRTTVPQIQTTIPQIQTTVPQIQTNIPIIHSTIPQIHSTITLIQTTIPQIQTTIPIIQTTIPLIQTTIPLIQTTIPLIQTTIPLIQTTIPQIQTNIPIIQTTIPQINIPETMNEQTSLILLGFNHFKLSSSSISFIILFTQILNEIYSNLMKALLIINYNENIRILEEKEIECDLKEKNKTNIVSFFCETEIKNSDIKNVKIIPKFNFINQTNITIIGLTPFARMYINNLQDIDDKYDNLENNIVYILDHSIYNKYSTYIYNITGIMNQEPKSKLEGKNINLMINLESEDEISTESSCTIIKNNENSYTLNCESRQNIDGDLQTAISFINEEEILLINFEGGNNSTITIDTPYKKNFLRKSSKGLKSGEIVAIILLIVFVLAAVIGLIIYFKNKKNPDNNESSIKTESKAYLNLNKI